MDKVFATPIETNIPDTNITGAPPGREPMLSRTEPPFSLYEGATGMTYTEKFFNAKDQNPTDISEIENFIKARISERGLKDTTETYDKMMNEIFAKLGIDEQELDHSKFSKTATYIRMLGKMELLKMLEEENTLEKKIAKLLERRK